MSKGDIHDCDELQEMISANAAIDYLLSKVTINEQHETVATEQALGRILAEDICSSLDIPPADNSAMDGYAFAIADIDPSTPSTTLHVAQRIAAGDPVQGLTKGTAARIFTGAPVPVGADVVLPQEQCQVEGDQVTFPAGVKAGANIRRRGEELKQGDVVLRKHHTLHAQEIGLLATLGVAHVKVCRKLKVGLFSTGDELMPLGQPLGSGQIYDSNRYTLKALLQQLGCEVIDLGRIEDNFETTCNTLKQAASQAEVILTSGGVSVGDEDHIKAAMQRMGEINLWRIAIKPGKPLAYGVIDNTPFFGLPGNPVAAFVTCCMFVRPYLLRMQGIENVTPKSLRLPACFTHDKAVKRREFLRASITLDEQGHSGIQLYPRQGSHMLTSVVFSEGLAIVPERTVVNEGDLVEFIPLDNLTRI
jgi:molybdopterin molybdotransferase